MLKKRSITKDKILILGDVFLDIFQTTDILKISPERFSASFRTNKKKLNYWVEQQTLQIIFNQLEVQLF